MVIMMSELIDFFLGAAVCCGLIAAILFLADFLRA
jgi:hypothetical protein